MPKPPSVKGDVKGQAKSENRHDLTQPNVDAVRWARGLTTQRVAQLFLTLQGLPGHWKALQDAINAGNRLFFTTANLGAGRNDGGKTSEVGKQMITWIADAVIAAAKEATFDFPPQQLKFTSDMGWLKLSRVNGKVVITSRP
jgi:hypothetical protein